MSANYVYSNTGLPLLQTQHQLVSQRSRSASASNTAINVGSQFQATYSQPYQQLTHVDQSWAQAQQGLYVNGLSKLMNIYPGQAISDLEQTAVSHSNEAYKLAAGLKFTDLDPRSSCITPYQSLSGNQTGVPTVPVQQTHPHHQPHHASHQQQQQQLHHQHPQTQQQHHPQLQYGPAPNANNLDQCRVSAVQSDPTSILYANSAPPNQSYLISGLMNANPMQQNMSSNIYSDANAQLQSIYQSANAKQMVLSSNQNQTLPNVIDYLPTMYQPHHHHHPANQQSSNGLYAHPISQFDLNNAGYTTRTAAPAMVTTSLPGGLDEQLEAKFKSTPLHDQIYLPHGTYPYMTSQSCTFHTDNSYATSIPSNNVIVSSNNVFIDHKNIKSYNSLNYQSNHYTNSTNTLGSNSVINGDHQKVPDNYSMIHKTYPTPTTTLSLALSTIQSAQTTSSINTNYYAMNQSNYQYTHSGRNEHKQSSPHATTITTTIVKLNPSHTNATALTNGQAQIGAYRKSDAKFHANINNHNNITHLDSNRTHMSTVNPTQLRCKSEQIEYQRKHANSTIPLLSNAQLQQKQQITGKYHPSNDPDYLLSFNNLVLQPPWKPRPELFAGGMRHILDACPLKILLSTTLVGSVIGRGGRTIRLITSKSHARITLQQDIVTFCQFHAPNSNKSTQTANKNSHVDDKSQIVILYGSNEQCCIALHEIMEICFREVKHRGLPDPCLGVLIEQTVYMQLLTLLVSGGSEANVGIGSGRRYFDTIHNATGARISVTSTSINNSSNAPDTANLGPNRVLVIRGQLNEICLAATYVTERIRWAITESWIPRNLWPLLSNLPFLNCINPLSTVNATTNAKHQLNYYDPQVVSNSMLSIAEIFWPRSIYTKLKQYQKHYRRFQSSINNNNNNNNNNKACVDVCIPQQSEAIHKIEDEPDRAQDVLLPDSADFNNGAKQGDANELEVKHFQSTIVKEGEEQDFGEVEQLDTVHHATVCATGHDDDLHLQDNIDKAELECNAETATNEEDKLNTDACESNLEYLSIHSGSTDQAIATSHYNDDIVTTTTTTATTTTTTSSSSTPTTTCTTTNYNNSTTVSAIQQSLITSIGSATWLVTGRQLYMRVSHNDAGLLIGTDGVKIRHLMQTTGAEIRIGKIPISSPVALHQLMNQQSTRDQHTGNCVQPRNSDKGCDNLPTHSPTTGWEVKSPEQCASPINAEDNCDADDFEMEQEAEGEQVVGEVALNTTFHLHLPMDELGSVTASSTSPTDILPNVMLAQSDSLKLMNSNDDGDDNTCIPNDESEGVNTNLDDNDSNNNNNNNVDGDAEEGERSIITDIHSADCGITTSCPEGSATQAATTATITNTNDTTTTTTSTITIVTDPVAEHSNNKSSILSNNYRLVALSGMARSLILAQHKIFQHLKTMHRKQNNAVECRLFQNWKTFSLASIICLPHRFVCWLTAHNSGFSIPNANVNDQQVGYNDSPENLDTVIRSSLINNQLVNRRKTSSKCTPLDWIQNLANKQLQALSSSSASASLSPDSPDKQKPLKIVQILSESKRRRRLSQQKSNQNPVYTNHNPRPTPLSDGLDQLWSDPNNVPIEIFADFNTTQLVLANIHHMLALWLQGQSLTGSNWQFSLPLFGCNKSKLDMTGLFLRADQVNRARTQPFLLPYSDSLLSVNPVAPTQANANTQHLFFNAQHPALHHFNPALSRSLYAPRPPSLMGWPATVNNIQPGLSVPNYAAYTANRAPLRLCNTPPAVYPHVGRSRSDLLFTGLDQNNYQTYRHNLPHHPLTIGPNPQVNHHLLATNPVNYRPTNSLNNPPPIGAGYPIANPYVANSPYLINHVPIHNPATTTGTTTNSVNNNNNRQSIANSRKSRPHNKADYNHHSADTHRAIQHQSSTLPSASRSSRSAVRTNHTRA